MKSTIHLYAAAVAIAALVSFVLTPFVRQISLRLGLLDRPESSVKTHKVAVPALGGVAIWLGFATSLLVIRFLTTFPTGTLRSLRGLFVGSLIVFLLGVIDDAKKPAGLNFRVKFVGQTIAAWALLQFGIQIDFLKPEYLAAGLTVFWVVGLTNAFNIIDIMDGLCATQAIIAAGAFLLIALPSEQIYVNFASASLLGAALGYLPWNFSKTGKIFMGDSGSMTLGFLLSAIAMGIDYSQRNPLGVYAPLFILLVPMYDTFYVMAIRIRKGHSPFLGSKDHFALRLERVGWSRGRTVLLSAAVAAFLGFCAFLATQFDLKGALALYALVAALVFWVGRRLALVPLP